MTPQTLYISILASSLALSTNPNPAALASIELVTQYAFDDNVIAQVMVIDEKTVSPDYDPLNHLIFKVTFSDKIDGSLITEMRGRLFTGGGVETLEELHADKFAYITSKLDFHGALDSDYDFFETVETHYNPADAGKIITALNKAKVINRLGEYRVQKTILDVPATSVTDVTPEALKRSLLDMKDRPRYLVSCEIDSLPHIEALADVMSKLNCHVLLDIGNIDNWESAVAITDSINIDDHRFWVFWNPNLSRPSGSTTVLARKKWRPCVGDYLAQLLLRNAASNANGIPPIDRPVAGYDFPVAFRDMEKFEGLSLDEEAQNALATAGINVVINERFEGGDRWIYGDAVTQYDSKTSALKLINAAEIETYTTNVVISITKKHLLKGMSSFINDATDECVRFLDACAVDENGNGMLVMSSELGGRYYALQITPRADNPFTKADVKFSRRPQGCARQVYFEGTVTK